MQIRKQLPHYIYLMRLDKPIGILLLLWPTLWALWLASHGVPNPKILFIFLMGVILMRSAGCVINDIFDQEFDKHVTRTRDRPLVKGDLNTAQALILASVLIAAAFFLVLFCNLLTIKLAFIAAILAIFYPLMKRFTNLPQLGLGVAFAWSIPMAFAAETGFISLSAWLLFLAGVLWPVIYDTMYAMVDKTDDLRIGIKSTAILLNVWDRVIIGLLQLLLVAMLILVGLFFHLHQIYYDSLVAVSILFIYQQWLIKDRDPEKCFSAFLNNHWVGLCIFLGILFSYL